VIEKGKSHKVYSPSSTGAGVDSFDLSASLGFALAFAKDLNISPADLFLFAPGFESVLLSVLGAAEGWGVDRPEASSSDALPFCADADASFSFATSFPTGFVVGFAAGCAAGFVAGFAAGFGFEAAVGGPALGALRYRDIS
jgi:hypothetical protein